MKGQLKPNILIADDARDMLEIYTMVLEHQDATLILAQSGKEALSMIRGKEIALALLDIRMPEMDGVELARRLQAERKGETIPIIFITGQSNDDVLVDACYKYGAVDYILKPFSSRILISKVKIFLELFQQKQHIVEQNLKLKSATDKLKRVHVVLKASEEKYRSYVDSAPDGVFITDETGKYIEVNAAACRITGFSANELLKMSFSDILGENSIKDGLAHFSKLIETGNALGELSFKHHNGSIRWWSVEAVKLSGTRFLGFTKDITKRLELEESLRNHQIELKLQNEELSQTLINAEVATQKYSELYDFAPIGYFILSSSMEILELNHSASRMLDKTRSEATGSQFGVFVTKNSLPVFDSFFRNVFKGKTKEICELVLQTNSNHQTHVHIEGISVNNGQQCLMNVTDITRRIHIEQSLKISEDKYKTLINASPDGIFLTDLKGTIMEVSDIGLEMIGANAKKELVGKNLLRFLPSDEKTVIREIIDKTMNDGLVQNIELKVRKQNQNLFASEVSATLIQGINGVPISFMFIMRDISQRKKMEAKQIHADRMANLGEMASGIAHEINQPLNIISMVMDKILFDAAKVDSITYDFLKLKSDKIFENIIRIKNIIDHVRAFSRNNDDYILTMFDINLTIENAVSMMVEQFKHLAIRLNLNLEREISQISGNTLKFEQVIVNLLVNAKDAVLEKKNKQDENYKMIIGIKSYQEKELIIIEVTDNGIGILNEDINNLILPFYTTKEEGKGTGLGLSICYQIIKDMGGAIEITSEPSQGTKIKLLLSSKRKN
ncbi:MAG: PAS domain S-box protein [Bacteroidota bacterium]